jgi:hypothetical protein
MHILDRMRRLGQGNVLIVATATGSAGVIIGTLMFGLVGMGLAQLFDNPARFALQGSP